MRAEAAPAQPTEPPRAGVVASFDAALRRAAGEASRARGRDAGLPAAGTVQPLAPAVSPPLAAPIPAANRSGDPAPAPEAAGAAGAAAARAVAAATVQRLAGGTRLEIASADGIRYALATGPGGIEIRAAAPPALERVARADLHAVADSLRRRGVAVTRAAVASTGAPTCPTAGASGPRLAGAGLREPRRAR